jgi:predicted type IV restriction endonuclease
MLLPDHIIAIRTGIASGKFSNEAAVSQDIVLRLLNALGWPIYDISVVCPEFSFLVDVLTLRSVAQPEDR